MWRFFFYAAPTISCRKGKSKAKSVNSKGFRVFDAVVFFNCCRQRADGSWVQEDTSIVELYAPRVRFVS